MQFRKSTSLILAFFILFSNLGLAFNVHYCHDKVASVSVDYQFKGISSESLQKCCKTNDNQRKCCSNKVVKLEKKSENILVKAFQLDFQKIILTQHSFFDFTLESNSVQTDETLHYYCYSNEPPLYKLNCQLVFYA